MLVMITACLSLSVTVFTRANSGKITTFQEVPLFYALVRQEPLHLGARNFVTKNWSPLSSPH